MSHLRKALDGRAMLIVVGLCFLWGLNQVAVKVANRGVSPIFQAALRSLVAASLVGVWARRRHMPLVHRTRTVWHGLAIGLLFGTEFVFIYLGLSYTTASHSVIFIYTAPFFVALGAHWLLPGEPLTGRKLAGLLLAFAGVVVTLWDSLGRPTRMQVAGDLMALLGGFLWAATSLYLKRVVRTSMTPSQMLFYQLGVSAGQLSVMSWFLEPQWIAKLSPLVVASLAYQGFIVAFASYLVWFWLIQVYPVSNVSAFTFFTPLFGVLLGGLLLHEPLTLKLLTGGGLVTVGMVLVNWPERWWDGRILAYLPE
ncbi:MAG TPA: DMT family transporter [Candidatus Methylomirabilis sp.]|nr:DMT family transporter [Candidatus Methylomirabilis sp.]